jgi:multiple sugar transport system permease protein
MGEGTAALGRLPRADDDVALRRARRRWKLHRNLVAFGFLAPVLVAFGMFLLFPIFSVLRQSFMSGGVLGPATWVGLDNWKDVPSDEGFRRALGHTFQYILMTVPAIIALSLLLAVLLRDVRRGKWTARALVYLPSLAPVVLAALVWQFVVSPDFGLANAASRAVGIGTVNWLGDPNLALPTIAALDVWRGLGFWALFLLAALVTVPRELYQAAEVDGAPRLQRFRHVTVPGITPTLGTAIVLNTLFSMQAFDSIFVLTRGGPSGSTETAVMYIYDSVFQSGNPGYGAVLSLVMVVVTVALTALVAIVLRRTGPRRAS